MLLLIVQFSSALFCLLLVLNNLFSTFNLCSDLGRELKNHACRKQLHLYTIFSITLKFAS
jgi:hypothetical protein